MPGPRTLRLAMAQMLVEGGRMAENLARAAQMVAQAARQGCRIVVLPECLDLGWTDPSAPQSATEIPGRASDVLCRAAAQAGLCVVAGLTERAGAKLYNAAVLIGPNGRVLLKHRKINLLDIEQPLYAKGDRLGVADTPCGLIGVNICADNFPESLVLGQSLARMGAELLLSPCAWAVPADHDPAAQPYGALWEGAHRTLARQHHVPVVGVSNVGRITGGPWSGRKCIGCSLAVAADGEILARGPYGADAEELVVLDVQIGLCDFARGG